MIAGGATASVLTTGAAAQAEPALDGAIAVDGNTLRAVVVSLGGDGKSMVAIQTLPADPSPYPLFRQFLTHKTTATAIYRAPPDHTVISAAPARDFQFIVAGEAIITADSGNYICGPGTVILADAGARHEQRAGKAGYTAIRVRLADQREITR